ncbi:FliH/SctL family protein [Parerythrobacter jejuensis]|uniref:Flagellar assembly protein FliH/Type III secretion system HrpE domain-containing protein n=1 Tax=Parerythrobacter jejuensis TaxID=795812 RepID=A0A845ASP3_9SPHN|nr:hypothetical protein [Parerythrobacter jejuensis]MXP30570.1 hypothetical protein [Parerythrobacter jejuensis]MXP33330.1 hypothetical protein [Parerythrobacter jejuensis]
MSVVKPGDGAAASIRPFRFLGGDGDVATAERSADATSGSKNTGSAGTQDRPEDERLVLARRISELEAALRAAQDDAAKERDAAREKGHQEGHKKGLAEAETKDAERLELLRKAIEAAQADTLKSLDQQRSLAIDIARATMGQILGDASNHLALVNETAAYWKDKLAGAAVLKLRVSSADFADAYAIEELQAGIGNLDIQIDDELKTGACIFDLQLGEVDASIPLQATRADAVLAEHGVEAGAA